MAGACSSVADVPLDADSSRTGAKGRKPGNLYEMPEVAAGGEVVIGHDKPFTAYNNQASDAGNFNNTIVLTPVLTGPYVHDDTQTPLLNTDVMRAVELTSTSPQVVTYRIKPGVRWSDGGAWDCDDFYLAWLAQSGKALRKSSTGEPVIGKDGKQARHFTPASTTGYELMTARCQDDLTLVTTYERPFPDYTSRFDNTHLLPAHVLERETGIKDITQVTPDSPQDVLANAARFWNIEWNTPGLRPERMLASGPYRFDSWQPNQQVRLVRNEKWAGRRGGPASVVLRNLEKPADQVKALQENKMQVIAPQADPETALAIRNLGAQGVKYSAGGGLTYEHLDLNFRVKLFQDKAVRYAFAQCVKRGEIVAATMAGVDPSTKPLGSLFFQPNEDGYQDQYSSFMLDHPEEALRTLQQAGWRRDGKYFDKNGKTLEFTLSHNGIPRRKQTAELIRASCEQAGIKINDDADPDFLDGRNSRGDYEVALFGWVGTSWKSDKKSMFVTGGGRNFSLWSYPDVDADLNAVDQEFDPAKRIALLQRADKRLAQEITSIPLFQVPSMVGYRDTIDKVTYHPRLGVTWNIGEWVVAS
ncbi:peptide/nickel transport system substrate-binding protein [Crossiella equi]|uniref:Peptide/nickel transport system substrate-binding protein n=1 Tax=Crossiella equi TaxID=130796 RepID=A0ABS5AIM9_9PSEU|nr:ABC transporter family substrate-binding protein [Crossiella equi]MBP2476437.1 peptide/nickel transport system substrate-binding protein [Crossiella equi]